MPHHITILFVLDSAEGIFFNIHSLLILIIMIYKKKTKKNNLCDLSQVAFKRALASSVGVKDGTFMSRAVTLVHPKRFLGTICKVFGTL